MSFRLIGSLIFLFLLSALTGAGSDAGFDQLLAEIAPTELAEDGATARDAVDPGLDGEFSAFKWRSAYVSGTPSISTCPSRLAASWTGVFLI